MSSAAAALSPFTVSPRTSWQSPSVEADSNITRRTSTDADGFRDTSFKHDNLSIVLDLAEAIEECCVRNWDGHGASPVNNSAISIALKFISEIPPQFEFPDVDVDPQGDICFEWYAKRGHVFSACVDGAGTIHYAGIFAGAKTHGTAPFGNEFPSLFVEILKRVFNYV